MRIMIEVSQERLELLAKIAAKNNLCSKQKWVPRKGWQDKGWLDLSKDAIMALITREIETHNAIEELKYAGQERNAETGGL